MTPISSSTAAFFRGRVAFVALLFVSCAAAQGISISVGPDLPLNYPTGMTILPDEHTTFVPPAPGSSTYLIFAASNVAPGVTGTVVLQSFDLRSFTPAPGYTNPVMLPPVTFSKCNPTYDTEFDENYAAQGSVLQDPTLPPGNLMMFYEAENHCPGGVNQQPFYATIGFARSSDNGVTWPAPENGPLGGPDRYPVLRLAAPEPASEPSPASMGNALPAAFVDKGNYVYVTYVAPPGPGVQGDGKLRLARAQLGGAGQLQLTKWYNGSFSQPGFGGLDSGFLPTGGCIGFQNMGQIYYVDPMGLYLMVFVCGSNAANPPHAAWYFSTATSLDLQDWTVPQMIANSQFPLSIPCPNSAAQGGYFDGWYPSLVSPGSAVGHLSLGGYVFFLNGCDVSLDRTFNARTFTITGPAIAPNYEGLWWAAPAGSESGWGINLAHQGDIIFASWFTYDLTGKGLWLVMTAPKTAPNTYSGTLYTTMGPAFNAVPFNPAQVTATAVGSGTLTFSDANDGTFAYTVNGIAQVKNITREVFGQLPTCVFGGGDRSQAVNYQDLWWAAPAGAESGWGVNLTHESDTIFGSWFTYDTDHTPMWLVATAAKSAPGLYSGTLYRTTGPPFNAVPFNPSSVVATAVGAATFNFSNGNTGTFSYTVNGVAQVKSITREVFTNPGTICL
jgi:hypothetical protein